MEPAPKDVAVERLAQRRGLERADEWVVAPGAVPPKWKSSKQRHR
jgi:hypothetical protein